MKSNVLIKVDAAIGELAKSSLLLQFYMMKSHVSLGSDKLIWATPSFKPVETKKPHMFAVLQILRTAKRYNTYLLPLPRSKKDLVSNFAPEFWRMGNDLIRDAAELTHISFISHDCNLQYLRLRSRTD